MNNNVQKTIIKNLLEAQRNAPKRAAEKTMLELKTENERETAKRIFSAFGVNLSEVNK